MNGRTDEKRSSVALEKKPGRARPGATVRQRLLVACLLILLPIINFAALIPRWGIGPCEDDLIQYLPQRFFLGQALRAGQLPLWNPFVYGGYPSAGDPQMAIWYPPNWMFAILPVGAAYLVVLFGHYSLAGWGMYRLMRAWRCCWRAALFSAVAFMFCGFLVAHRVHLTMICSAAYLPAVLWALERFLAKPGSRRLAAAASLTGLQMLAGHVQMAALTAAVAATYALYVAAGGSPRIRSFRAAVLGAAGVYALAVALYAVQLLPTLKLLGESVRLGNSYRFFTENSFHPLAFSLWFFPALLGVRCPNWLYGQNYFGPWNLCELCCYGSIVVIVLAVWAAVVYRSDRRVRFLVVLAVVGMLLALGRDNPAYRALFYVPLYRTLRCPARHLLWVNFAFAALAGFAARAIFDSPRRGGHRDSLWRFAAIFLPVTAIGFVAYFAFMRYLATAVDWTGKLPGSFAQLPQQVQQALRLSNPALVIPFVLMAVTLAALYWLRRAESVGSATAVLLALLVVDLGSFMWFNDIDVQSLSEGREVFESAAGRELAALGEDEAGPTGYWPLSTDPYEKPLKTLHPYTNLLYVRQEGQDGSLIGPASINGYGPLLPGRMRRLLGWELWGSTDRWLQIITNAHLLTALGVEYVLVEPRIAEVIESLRRRADDPVDLTANFTTDSRYAIMPGERVAFHVPGSSGRAALCWIDFEAAIQDSDNGRLYITTPSKQPGSAGTRVMLTSWDLSDQYIDIQAVLLLESGESSVCFRADNGAVAVRDISINVSDPPGLDYLRRTETLPAGQVLYRNENFRGRIYLPDRIHLAKDAQQAMDYTRRRRPMSDGKVTCVLEADQALATQTDPNGRIDDVRWGINTVRFRADLTSPGVAVIADGYDPDWKAYVDGRPTRVYRANLIHKAVTLPAGVHQVVLKYQPARVYIGLLITSTTAALLIALAAGRSRRLETGR